MNISNFFLLLVLLVLSACYADNTEGVFDKKEINIVEEHLNKMIIEREELGFIGKVKSSLEYEFAYDDMSSNTIKLKESKYHSISADTLIEEIRDVLIRESNSFLFDKFGKLITSIRFVEHDDIYLEDIENYIFDTSGKLIEWNKSDFDMKQDNQKIFEYDNTSRLIEYKEFARSSLVIKTNVSYLMDTIQYENVSTNRGDTTYTMNTRYNKYGEVIEPHDTKYDPSTIMEYDEKDNLISVKFESVEGSLPSYYIDFEYDQRNNKTRETRFDSTRNVDETTMFYYNEKNELIQEIEIDTKGTEIRRFDESGNVYDYTSSPFNEEESGFYNFWCNFDQYGNETKRIIIEKDENDRLIEGVTEIKLEYDEFGNCVSKKVYRMDSLVTVIERKIIYY